MRVWVVTGVFIPIIGPKRHHRSCDSLYGQDIVASISISDVIKFQNKIYHFVQQGKEKSPKDRKKKNNYCYSARTAPIHKEGEDVMLNHTSLLPFIAMKRIQ